MTMRVCFLGNSHLVAPRRAWQANPHPDYRPNFIAMPGDDMKKLVTDGRVLRMPTPQDSAEMARTSNGQDHIVVDDYDAFVLCGLTLRFFWMTGLYQTHRLVQHARPEDDLISSSAFKSTVRETLIRKSSYMTLANIRRLTDKPVIVIAEPLPTTKVLESKYKVPWAEPFIPELLPMFDDVVDRLYERHNAIIVHQPEDTVENTIFTQAHYADGAIRLWGNHKFDDSNFLHMNDVYGAKILDVILARLGDFQNAGHPVAISA